ncbi:ABC transporter permease subunit [Conexibacter sp. JD483]|uniref:PstC family ABC transporter permease n=1 Tax=unclassified Conexibacter TaxID=2627773 RepID=UPI00271B003E|nr:MULTISPECIES: ABC transporter permease subunit [unclassified Conexibacter]MDO8187472.1 ABC transporter permease subunit [Conexibacter sp. CPCC 205706]MDO8198706.1 ABC transporter permease subunit [Conexibacter sp. CPCC 205762]MDR9369884.1 ABC transporter permease subunit [Conexibacter sp. JD483]
MPRRLLPDQRAELVLGALVCAVLLFVLTIVVFVFKEAWPSFQHNGWAWFSSGGNVDRQIQEIFTAAADLRRPVYTFHAWPIIWGTFLITTGAVALSFVAALFVSVFIVEFAPEWIRTILEPVVRLLASVPSVIFGLVGVLVLVPFIGEHVISDDNRRSVSYIVSLSGYSLLAGVLILTLMIAPLMIAVFSDGLRSVPRGWLEGSLGLGINRWRTFWKIGVRTARPALVAGTVLATARALGEAVMLAMVTGGVAFAPNPADGVIFFVEPTRPLAATILQASEELTAPAMRHTIFAIAAVLLFSALMLSLTGWVVKQPMKKYGVRA